MLTVQALTAGENISSARFRVRQYIPELRRRGIEVRESPAPVALWSAGPPVWLPNRRFARAAFWGARAVRSAASRTPGILHSLSASLIWLQKELVPGLVSLEPILPRPYVFDVDDAVWLQGGLGRWAARTIARGSRVTIAGSRAIAEWAGDHAARVEVVPTPVDTHVFRPPDRRPEREQFVVGWVGSRSALPALETAEAALRRFLEERPAAELRVVCSHRPGFTTLPEGRWRFIAWTPEVGPAEMRGFDVGIMPLVDDPAGHAKCGLKMLQYMSCGVPVVVSPFGFNGEVLERWPAGYGARTVSEWVDGLNDLVDAPERRRVMGAVGRRAVLEEFSLERCADRLAAVLRSAAD